MSKETKFTKGDWFVGFNKTSVYTGSEVSGEGNIVSQCGGFRYTDRDEEECKANARLIKTAPKLYAEIESEIALLTKLMTDNFTVNCSQSYEIIDRIDSLGKALAEARGE